MQAPDPSYPLNINLFSQSLLMSIEKLHANFQVSIENIKKFHKNINNFLINIFVKLYTKYVP